MADIQAAIDYVLRQEDSTLSGAVVNDPADRGGRTRFGIAERFHPELAGLGFFDGMPYHHALGTARQTYASEYGAPLQLAQINSQHIANAMLSFAVNEGIKTSIELLQRVLSIEADGIMGPITLHVLNCNASVLSELGKAQATHYRAIVAANPNDARFLDGWLNRIQANCGPL